MSSQSLRRSRSFSVRQPSQQPSQAQCAVPAPSARSGSRAPSQSRAQSQAPQSSRSRSLSNAHSQQQQQQQPQPQQYQSNIEQQVIAAQTPIRVDNASRIRAGRYSGLHLNKEDDLNFNGPQPLCAYAINDDPNPEVIKKRAGPIKYKQEVTVKHLNPPTPPPHGDLIVRERQQQIPAAPPVVLRQEGQGACTPPPQIYREQPPRPPTRIPTANIEVEGEPIPPPARRVVVEKLSDLPQKPQNILIEKWLPYKQQKRRVVFQRSCVPPPPNPRNLIIEWEQPCVEVEQVCKDLGVVDADPEEYIRQYGCELKQACEIPDLCPCIKPKPRTPTPPPCGCQQPKPRTPTPPPPCGCQQQQQQQQQAAPALSRSASLSALSRQSRVTELEGDVDALRLVNLSREGLQRYRKYL